MSRRYRSDETREQAREANAKGGRNSQKREPDWHDYCAAAWTKFVDDEALALMKEWNKVNDTEGHARARRELEDILDRAGASSEEFRKRSRA